MPTWHRRHVAASWSDLGTPARLRQLLYRIDCRVRLPFRKKIIQYLVRTNARKAPEIPKPLSTH